MTHPVSLRRSTVVLTVAAAIAAVLVVGCGGTEQDAVQEQENDATAADLIGWAAVAGNGRSTTTGGGSAAATVVTSLSQLAAAAGGTDPRVITISGAISGSVSVGSHKTIQGAPGAVFRGHLQLSGSVNVIVRNLKIVGFNCSDNSDCQSGADAVTVDKKAHHLWFSHLDISDGSDGNLDITHGSDFITVSWTKFHYSGSRSGGHQFSNLIGHSDSNSAEDSGHLKVTFHHDWWADHVGERMPRVRFGHVHSFNNLFTSSGNNYCFRAGVSAQILAENNVFSHVDTPFDLAGGTVVSRGNLFVSTTGNRSGSGSAFTPPYSYSLDAASAVQTSVTAGAGPR